MTQKSRGQSVQDDAMVAAVAQLDYLQVVYLAFADVETHQRPDGLPSLQAGGTGVDVHHAQGSVVLHLQDVRVSADKQVGGVHRQLHPNARVIVAGRAADMGHEDTGLLHLEPESFMVVKAYVAAITVAADGAERCDALETRSNGGIADVSGMPYFVTAGKVRLKPVVPTAVGVREQSYAFHCSMFSLRRAMSRIISAQRSVPKTEVLRHRS